MSDQLVLIETRDRIATMTLNRPPMNPMSNRMFDAILATRRAVNFNIRHSWDEMERYEQDVCREVFAHPDAAEGPRAFTEKREPRFTDL